MSNENGNSNTSESVKELLARIRPLMDEIRLPDDIPDSLQGSINMGELSGDKASEEAIKIMVLKKRGVVTDEQTLELLKSTDVR